MSTPYQVYQLGDLCLSYDLDEQGHIGMQLTPWGKPHGERHGALEPLVQWHLRGDRLAAGYGNGHTMATTESTDRLRFVSQAREGDAIVTTLKSDNGCIVRHHVIWHDGLEAVRICSEVENASEEPCTMEMITSANLGGLSPYMDGEGIDALALYRARSSWSVEGRLTREIIEDLQLERSWTGHALRLEKFGQIGSMPVRGFFPFAAVEDVRSGVIWAMQLACPTSWQFELRRKDDGLSLSCGLADMDYGHWCKTLQPGETLTLPEAYLTVGEGDIDAVAQRLLSIHRENLPNDLDPLPVFFNEYCTTWGNPTHENLSAIVNALKGHDVDYLVIDCGWYGKPGIAWSDCNGDWIPNEQEMFPEGLRATADMIRSAGLKPGIWFEPENCARFADIFQQEDMLLKRDGVVIDTWRRFLDLRKPEVKAYLDERVIGLLRACDFKYIKIDYNDTIGVGCDGAESLGEGLRQVGQESLNLFRRIRENVPGILIENCSSGGHRLEPSYMGVADMASFSDAHEQVEIPIIAACLQRLILPYQSQIWAVLQATDSLRRINYSLVNTLLGVMCLSGDIHHLSAEQWAQVDQGVAFYREVSPIIRRGTSRIHQHLTSPSWRQPKGWQAVVRTAEDGQELIVIHTFGGELPEKITLPVRAERIVKTLCTEQNQITLANHELTVELKAPFEAIAIHATM